MSFKSGISAMLAVTLAVAILAGCATAPIDQQSASANSEAGTITVTDDAKHEVTLKLPIERVALLDTGPGEALAAVGMLLAVVGTHKALQNSLNEEIGSATMVATYTEINYVALAETRPQLVLSATSHHGFVSEGDHLDEFEIQFIALDLRTPSRMRDDFRLLGKVFQKEAEAQRVMTSMTNIKI